jgi:hypothetical protein
VLPETIYHYTNIRSFKSIVRNKQLWLTHYKYVNDTEEIITGLTILDDEIKNYLSKCGQITGKIKLSNEIFDQYLLCFCGRLDNDHLWENYSKKGGVVLGFSTAMLLKSQSIAITPVSYDIDEYRNLCREKINLLKPILQEDENKLQDYIRKTGDQEKARELLQEIPNYKEYKDTISYLSTYATLLKNPKWIKEEEVRMIHWPVTCKELNVPILNTDIKGGRPRAFLPLDKIPLVSLTTYLDEQGLKRKGIYNFLLKHDINLLPPSLM